jgi:diguanylate cyclase (GGDEF)-like protein
LDRHECIVLVNTAFVKATELSGDELLGQRVAQIPWAFTALGPDSPAVTAPWSVSLRTGKVQRRLRVSLKRSQDTRAFMVSTTAILAPDGSRRGVLASFDDVTWLEDKNTELQKMISLLEESRDTVSFQNEELKKLATRDPLTGCLNRRAFFELIDAAFEEAKRYGGPLACILLDVDHFKVVNDRYGHAAGDQVLQFVASTLHANLRASDRLCRYGGEEFCILLARADVAAGVQVAEKIRAAIAASPCGNISLTASFGVSGLEFRPASPAEMIDQADQALYAAKHQGRNRVMNYSQGAGAAAQALIADDKNEHAVKIPFHAVQALMAALAQRDPSTAWHARRVADLCVATVHGLLSVSDTFVFEVAALLHDIGKIGVPDAILLKPGPLTADEWHIMEQHARMGIEILDATFGVEELTAIVRNHHAWFAGSRRDPGLPLGEQIPLRSRILSIADAYDAIVSDRVYRKARSHDEAVAELRRCAGTQFDPLLVERFITAVEARNRHGVTPTLSFHEERALTIGLATERLASSVVSRDLASVAAQAQHLVLSAAKFDLPRVAELASELYKTSSVEYDILKAMRLTQELCQLCQSTHSSTQNDQARLPRSEGALHVREIRVGDTVRLSRQPRVPTRIAP